MRSSENCVAVIDTNCPVTVVIITCDEGGGRHDTSGYMNIFAVGEVLNKRKDMKYERNSAEFRC